LAALIVATVPLWMVLFRSASSDRSSRLGVVGTALGFLGLALLLRADTAGFAIGWALLIVAASASWAIGSTIQRVLPLPRDNYVTTAYEMIFGGIFLLVGAGVAGETFRPRQVSAESAAAWVYLTLAGSLLAFSCYSWLLSNSRLSFVSTYAYINPVVAVVLGVVFLGETLPPIALVGGAVTLVGVMVVVRFDGGRAQEASLSNPARKALR
jgi:drug/metabolite transporter (DMT)-like permease